ncbi:exosortase family protein XrtG [Companilactobacillus farciminis]|uniref:exosortase family protein XrtG n=1 Tax=Companilactobacillus farciminis TaxID=1612 RepID=UPI00241BE845|nr:exosortase family protein XrtG [Companilactobacillus farciminis]
MSIYLVIGIVVWIYLLSVLKRAHVPAFFFLIGTGGLFFILIGFSDPYWVWFFTHSVINGVKWFGNLTNMSEVMNRYGLISINNATQPLTMTIDYECSGIIETMAYISIVAFFPIFNRYEKAFFGVFGILWIYLANVLRLALIIIIVHFAGGSAFFIGHSIVGRMVFYILVIALYYNVFTYSQISHSLYQNFRRFITRIKKRLSKEE